MAQLHTDAPSLTADRVKFYISCDGSAAYFYNKDRVFNPNTDPKYANDLGLPSLLLMQNPIMGITHMKHGPEFAHAHAPGKTCAETETLVMVVAARKMNGYTAVVRWFGHYSGYNRQSLASKDTVEEQVLSTICCGCNTIRDITIKHKHIKKVFIVTSSEFLIDSIVKLFDWTKFGFPKELKGEASLLLGLLRGHIQSLEESGLEIKFWKVAPEHTPGLSFSAECVLLDHFDVPSEPGEDNCRCENCVDYKQYREMKFAKFGMACCDCTFGLKLAKKYGNFKKGEKLPLTNNAGIEVLVEMRVDGKGMKFQENHRG